MNDRTATSLIEVKYLSQSYTHLQVEYTDESGYLGEAWIMLTDIKGGFNMFDEIMELEVYSHSLDMIGIPHD